MMKIGSNDPFFEKEKIAMSENGKSKNKVLLFTYGTLKRGHCRHNILQNEEFIGVATTTPGYRVFDLGSFPGIVESQGGIGVTGELYLINSKLIPYLDQVEGVAYGLYRYGKVRFQQVTTDAGEDITKLFPEANVYFYNRSTSDHEECSPTWG